MLKEYIVRGSRETTFHSFQIVKNGNTITISDGEYVSRGQVIYNSADEITIELEARREYQIWLTNEGIIALIDVDDETIFGSSYIDRLAWGNTDNLYAVKMVE